MNYKLLRYFYGIIFFVFIASTATFGEIHHDLMVTLCPDEHWIRVVDTITLPETVDAWPIIFALHKGFEPKVRDAIIKKTGNENGLEIFEINLPSGVRQFTIMYEGEIFHPIDENSEEYARGFSATPGIISPQGVFLSGSTVWYPHFYSYFTDRLLAFNMNIILPSGWSSISQGVYIGHNIEGFQWDTWFLEDKPQEEIYLIANKFVKYNQRVSDIDAMVFLRQPDAQLAQKYLDATAKYIEMYSKLLGPYPYGKFSLVENFWNTGYGMPSFTLLGSDVINFPFILHSSYPHEILHNWWGNGVYVDSQKGNWCEGLTAYLADYFLKEQQGEGAEHRRLLLQKYKNFVKAGVGRDFPISKFSERHSGATEAIGYGKTAMFFHMLRRQVGDEIFFKALRQFYAEYKFKFASFDDIERVFSETSGQNLRWMFEQWIERTGAPSLKIRNASVKLQGDKYLLSAIIEQTQNAASYRLKSPIIIHMRDENFVEPDNLTIYHRFNLDFDKQQYFLSLELPYRPIFISIDSEFDVFRELDRNETPPAMSLMFGAEKVLAVLPANAPESIRSGYRALAKSWRVGEIKLDKELSELPNDRAVWIFGWENKFRPDIRKALSCYDFEDNQGINQDICINGVKLQRNQHSVVIMARHQGDYALGWLATDNASAIPGLGRKLPHYNRYGYLGFSGDEPTIEVKGQWPIVNSPLSISLENVGGSTPYMKDCVEYLASEELEGRGLGTQGIDKATEFIAEKFREIGLAPAGDNESYFQTFQYVDEKSGHSYPVKNIIGIIRGKNDKENIVIGAHYDHLGYGWVWPDIQGKYKGQIHPGANDNASGVAVLLELARSFKSQNFKPDRNIIFIAFSAEEIHMVGSKYYVNSRRLNEKYIGMINLDTVGRVENNSLLATDTQFAEEWKEMLEKVSIVVSLKIDFVAVDLRSSDQVSFNEVGIPAIQICSGAYADYHKPTDTADKINFSGLVKVAKFTEEVVKELMNRDLTPTLKMEELKSEPPKEKIKVSLGTIPDYTYQGVGYRLAGVKPDSPAETAGLKEGDIIVKINNEDIKDLRGFAEVLRSLSVGDKISVTFLRNKENRETEAVLK